MSTFCLTFAKSKPLHKNCLPSGVTFLKTLSLLQWPLIGKRPSVLSLFCFGSFWPNSALILFSNSGRSAKVKDSSSIFNLSRVTWFRGFRNVKPSTLMLVTLMALRMLLNTASQACRAWASLVCSTLMQ